MSDDKPAVKTAGFSLIAPEVQNKMWDDLASGPARELSKLVTDAVKAIRYWTGSVQYWGLKQEQLAAELEQIRNEVPPEFQVAPKPEISVLVIQRLYLLEDTDKLREAFLNLLKASIDSRKADSVHPGFVQILERISADDALHFWRINKKFTVNLELKCDGYFYSDGAEIVLIGNLAKEWGVKTHVLLRSIEVLRSLALIQFTYRELPPMGGDHRSHISLSTSLYGEQFAELCLPNVFDLSESQLKQST